MAQSLTSTHFKAIHTFNGQDGAFDDAGVLVDKAGNVYAAVTFGGDKNLSGCNGGGCGLVIKIDPSGKPTVLHRFTGKQDGGQPQATLIMDASGNLYGTTTVGGNDAKCVIYQPYGCGVVFKVAADGTFTVLYTFKGGSDGAFPVRSQLVLDKAGNFYGTTWNGGSKNPECGYAEGSGCGVIYKVDPSGTETVLYRFTGGADGAAPDGLVQDAFGNLYGTAVQGGSGSCTTFVPAGCGTVWKLDTKNHLTVLHNFAGSPSDGAYPYSGVIRDTQGNLYGVTVGGGDPACTEESGCGVAFKVSASGKKFTVLHSFMPDGLDGFWPVGAPVLDKSGDLYGTTGWGGNFNQYPCTNGYGCGVVFKIDKGNKETIVYGFKGEKDGGLPGNSSLDAEGNIYGTTYEFGDMNGICGTDGITGCGTVFKITQ
jgi:uncharacterized repeat protein (TIGR03803 family)